MREQVLEEFKKLSAVPRRSFYVDKILDYCISWAKTNGFEYIFDSENGNVVIKKPAAPGMEEKPGIVLQGHLDMVAETDEGVEHDWDNEGIEIIEDGDFLTANGTTLGADNGNAAAISFAILKDETVKNPALEVLLTTNEEVGMLSVKNADLSFLKGKYLLNLDSGPEGEFTIGCCGGALVRATIKNTKEKNEKNGFYLVISGLTGGHSGMEIANERANAIKLAGEVLSTLVREFNIRVSEIKAPGKDNAITNKCEVVFACDESVETIRKKVKEIETEIRKIYRISDPEISITVSQTECKEVLEEKESRALIYILHQLPYGVSNFEQDLSMVETSNNVGPIETDENKISIFVSVRSSVAERMKQRLSQLEELCTLCGAGFVKEDKSYPAWLPDYDSPLLPRLSEIYENMYGKQPVIRRTHGGLECGFVMSNSNIEAAVAIGPTTTGEHTTSESVQISSLMRTYDFVKAVIEQL